ncbi:MAG TPA: flippase [Candidatus Saccharimonadia bacterium]
MFGKRILKNTGVQAVGKVITVGLSFFTLSLTTRYLGPEQYGVLSTVTVFLSFFAISSDLGLSLFGLRELAQSRQDAKAILSSLLSLRLVMSLVSAVLALIIGFFLGYSREFLYGLLLMSPTLLFNTATSAISIYFQHNLHMRYVVTGEVVAKAATLAGLIYVVHNHLGLNSIFLLNAFGAGVFTLAVYIFARSHIQMGLNFNFHYWRKALWLSIPLGLASVLNSVYYRLDTIMLSLLNLANSIVPHVSNFEAVGLYQVPYRLIEVIMIFPGLFITSVFPVMAAQSDLGEVWQKRTQKAYDFLLMFAVPLVVFVVMFSPQIIRVIAGTGYEVSAELLRVLIFAVALSFLNALLGFLLVARHRERDVLNLAIVTIILNFLLNLVLIPRFSYYAAAYMSVFSEFLCLAASLWFARQRFHFVPGHMVLAKSALVALLAAPAVYWLPRFAVGVTSHVFLITCLAAGLYALVYFGLLIPVRVIDPAEVRHLLKPSNK